jgi:L-threonylcarbamoyladenylate synthase
MKNFYSNINKSKKILDDGKVVAIPTETVYGLAGNAYSDVAVKRIFKLKNRPYKNPLIVHYFSIKNLHKDCKTNKIFDILYNKFCPGPITFVLNKKNNSRISKYVTSNKKTVAVRFPNNKIARTLLSRLSFPLAAPSANISSKLSPTCSKDVKEEFGNKIKFILDGGNCKIGLESTIIDLTGKPSILRPGIITLEKIRKVLKKKISIKKTSKKIKAPGQLKFHYYPGIPVKMNKKYPEKNQALIGFGKKFKTGKNRFNLSKNGNLKEAANNLYKTMRLIKKRNFKSIAVTKIPSTGIGYAINDRLKKASNK